MNGPDPNFGPDPVRDLIETEVRTALARFRGSRFADRLKKRPAEQAVRLPTAGRLRPALRPVLVALAALIILSAAAVWLLQPRPHIVQGGTPVAALLRGLPGLHAIEFPAPPPAGVSPLPASPLEKNISSVLSVSRETGGAPGPAGRSGFSVISPKSEPLGLQRFYEILVIDKSVERVLLDISPKIKEG